MKSILVLLLCLVLLVRQCDGTSPTQPPKAAQPERNATQPFSVFGYLPEYRVKPWFPYEAVFSKGLTHLIFFSLEINETTLELEYIQNRLPPMEEWKTIRALADQYNVKLMICIGGSGRSDGYAKLVNSTETENFFEQLTSLYNERNLDGIDFNWEYPTKEDEFTQLNTFIGKVRSALQATHRNPILTMPVHPHPNIATILRITGLAEQLDYIHWMAYTHGDENRLKTYTQSVILNGFNNKSKLTLGVEFYAIQEGKNPISYSEMVVKSLMNSTNPKEEAEKLKREKLYEGFSYTNYYHLQEKMDLARDVGFSGLMIWEIGHDILTFPKNILQRAVDKKTAEWMHTVSFFNAIHDHLKEWEKGTGTTPPPQDNEDL